MADKIEAYHTYFQYIMAWCSRGQYAPNFGGLLFSTRGDIRDWGATQWGNNISCYYRGLSSSNRPEVVEPFFRHYLNTYDSLATAAYQQFGAGGIYLPETVCFDGLEVVPDDIASELRELMPARTSWSGRSDALVEYAASKHPHNSRWNWKGPGKWGNGRWTYPERPTSPFGPVTHMVRGATRTAWIAWEFFDNMAPLATNDDPEEIVGVSSGERRVWVGGLKPCRVESDRNAVVDVGNYYMDLCTLETRESDPELFELGENTFLEAYDVFHGENDRVSALSRMPLKAALLGHTYKVRELLPAQMFRPGYDFCCTERSFSANGEILANRLTVREGQAATGAQRLGNATAALYLALVQSVPAHPGGPLTLRLFPSWPREWDAEFRLLCRGGYMVSCSMTGGEIEPVTIESCYGGPCRVRNPWPGETVKLSVDGRPWSFEHVGDLLTFDTTEGETFVLECDG